MNLLAYLALILFSVSAGAANHYIRAGATGTGSGDDWTNATTSWPASFTRGDTYYVAAGSYPGKLFNTAHSGVSIITIRKATVADHGTNTGWSDTYATGQAAFTSGFEFRTGYWTIDGVTGGGAGAWSSNLGMKITETRDAEALIKLGNPTLAGTTGYDIAPNVTIRHVEMQGKGSVSVNGGSYSNDGVANYGNDGFTLSYYWMYGIGRCPVYSSGRNMVIEHGWVESFYGSVGVHSEIASVWGFYPTGVTPIGSHTFRYNLFTHIWSTGGLMWDGADNASANFDVYGNTFYKPSGATWEVANGLIGGWSARNFRNARVYNNTFINVDQESLSSLPGTYSGNVAYNNLWYNSNSPNFTRFATHDYNRFINSGTTQSEPNGTSAASGNPFTDYVNFDFTLTGGTTAGISTLGSPFNVDPFGLTRGSDGTWDRGAYEFSSGGAPDPISASANITEANTTISSSVVLVVAGSLSKAEQEDTGTVTGQVPIFGIFAGTEDSFLLGASGVVLSGLSAGLLVSEQTDTLYPDGVAILVITATTVVFDDNDVPSFLAQIVPSQSTTSTETTTAKYCVRADGTAVAPIDTHGVGTDPTQCMPLPVANVQTYTPGATIYLFAAGGTFTTPLSNTPTPCTGLAYSVGREGYPITFAGVPDLRGNPPVIDGAGLSTPQVCVGDRADYIQITGVDVWGSKSTATPSVRIGSDVGSAGSSYTVQLSSIRVLGNNRNSLSGDHSCFEIAGPGSSVDFFGVTGTGCVRSAGETASGVSAGLAVYGTSRATIGNSAASLSGQCLYVAGTGQIEGTSVACSRILYSGVRHGGIAQTTCSGCSFDFGATYVLSGGAGFFGADADLPASSISLIRPKITVRTGAAARVGYGAVSMNQGSILVDSAYFEWKPAGQVTLSGMQNRLRTTAATPKHFYSAQAGSTSIFDSNTWTYEDRSSIRRAVPFYISGSLTATKDSHIGCSRLYGSPTAAIIYGVTGNLTLSGVTCR